MCQTMEEVTMHVRNNRHTGRIPNPALKDNFPPPKASNDAWEGDLTVLTFTFPLMQKHPLE